MYIDDRGLVIQTVRCDDTTLLVHLFTQSHGCAVFSVRRPKSAHTRTSSILPLLAPLSFLTFQWDCRPGITVYRMRDVHPFLIHHTVASTPAKSAIALMLGEFLWHALRSEGENAALFDYLVNAFAWLDEATTGYANFHLVLMLKVARFLGIDPTPEEWDESLMEQPVSALDIDTLCRLRETSFETMNDIALTGSDRSRLAHALEQWFCAHLPAFPPLKSLAVMESLFK